MVSLGSEIPVKVFSRFVYLVPSKFVFPLANVFVGKNHWDPTASNFLISSLLAITSYYFAPTV